MEALTDPEAREVPLEPGVRRGNSGERQGHGSGRLLSHREREVQTRPRRCRDGSRKDACGLPDPWGPFPGSH